MQRLIKRPTPSDQAHLQRPFRGGDRWSDWLGLLILRLIFIKSYFTVNDVPLVVVPVGVVTLIFPVVAPVGTVALILVAEVTVKLVAATPLNCI